MSEEPLRISPSAVAMPSSIDAAAMRVRRPAHVTFATLEGLEDLECHPEQSARMTLRLVKEAPMRTLKNGITQLVDITELLPAEVCKAPTKCFVKI